MINSVTLLRPQVIDFSGAKAYALEALFIAVAVLFPMVAHAAGWPVFAMLPMHWTVLLAGLVFGSQAGLIAGISAPLLSFVVTGMPIPMVLPLIVLEVAVYGSLSGLLREKSSLNTFTIVLITLIAGRSAFVAVAFSLGRINSGLLPFLESSFAAGIPAAVLQILLLPVVTLGLSRILRSSEE